MTMKKYIIFIASAVLMMTACVKEEINTTITGETEFISVELNAATKTHLLGTITNWTPGDQVRVTVDGKNLGSLTLVEGNIFAGEIESVGLDGKLSATINYPADVTEVPKSQKAVAGSFADEAALLEGTTTLAELRKGNGAELANKTALLQFTVAQAGDVTFEVGTKKYTVTGCQTGSTYYACVEPATTGVNLSYTIGGIKGVKSKTGVTFTVGKIYNLGKLSNKVRFYVETERTPFDIYLYTFDSNENNFSGSWPGSKLAWDTESKKYYFDLPSSVLNKKLNYIVNYNSTYQTEDLSVDVSQAEVSVKVDWKWLYFNWKEGGAWFAAYFFTDNGGEYWSDLVGPRNDGTYGVVVPNGHKKVIFTRMDSGKPGQKNWEAKWNQTANLTVPTGSTNLFKCTEGWWDALNGAWSTYSFN